MSPTDVALFDEVVKDERPPSVYEHACLTCGTEVTRKGDRGRWPKFCPAHKDAPHRARTAGTPGKGTNAALAAQASEALCQVNALAVMGLMLAQLPDTASAVADREDVFREQAYAALLTDPALAKVILRAGTTGGKISLAIAYAMLGASVAPVAVMEFRAGREARREDRSEDDRAAEPA